MAGGVAEAGTDARQETAAKLRELLAAHHRVAIVGGPRTGKTVLARLCTDRPVLHTDDAMALGWDAQPDHWCEVAGGHERFLIEGVQVARTLRRGLEVDAVLVLSRIEPPLTPGQRAMTQGIWRAFTEWAHTRMPGGTQVVFEEPPRAPSLRRLFKESL